MDNGKNTFYSEDDAGYISIHPDFKGASAFGDTPEEAEKELDIVIEMFKEKENG